MLEKTFDPKKVESKLYENWEKSGAFGAQKTTNEDQDPFVVMMPPPNVTGSLHIGHALNCTLQDILVRYHRMRGRDVLWQPGMDHAGIATQALVERQIGKEGLHRQDLGREKFLSRVWQWKEEHGGVILKQQRRLGLSPDWSRERFTLDEGLSQAVRKVFVELYREGLIYRDKRLVNWDPKLLTVLSDLEVNNVETNGTLTYFKYPIEGKEGTFITIATTRPETMLGDTAVVVHPEDDRYRALVGRHVILPLVGRRIPILADPYSDPEKGSGAVKITPAHDFNDFEVGLRHDLESINIFDERAHLNENVPEKYQGMERFAARKQIISDMKDLGFYEKSEDTVHMVPHGDRSHEVLEPRLTDQWFVDAKTLAQPAIQAVRSGKTKIVPEQSAKTYFNWLEEIQPWCISRQLWWGHRIPAWYGPDGEIFVAYSEDEAQALAKDCYGKGVVLTQDEDVLDTWFSSALWPFSTLGWPEETLELKKYYPSTTLITGVDLIFFWVARMMMMGLHFMKDVPFKAVYMHALVRDEKGQKMSKSKGNVIDPLVLMEEFGADALRFTMSALAAPGRNVNFSKATLEGYRNFATKLWNSARFCEHYGCVYNPGFNPKSLKSTVNRWIVGELSEVDRRLHEALEAYRFDEAASLLYHFVWGTYCDWYLEFSKPLLDGGDEDLKLETQNTVVWVLAQICHILHPFMPFITEELWHHLRPAIVKEDLISADWPELEGLENKEAKEIVDWWIRLISDVRAVRSEVNIPPGARLNLGVMGAGEKTYARLEEGSSVIKRLARLGEIVTNPEGQAAFSKGVIQSVLDEATLLLPVGEVIDLAQERQRLQKNLKEFDKEILSMEKKLGNKEFVAKAPAAVLEKNQKRRDEAVQAKLKVQQALQRLENM